jgi:hypothetical protein
VILSQRIADRVKRDFPAAPPAHVVDLLRAIDIAPDRTPEGEERIYAAILKIADRDVDRLLEAIDLAESDWRDVLVSAGFANDDWRLRVAAWLEGDNISSR